jgi:hypothetical protein
MKNNNNFIIFATAYPYTMGILAIVWIGSAMLLIIDKSLSITPIIVGNVVATIIIAGIGFRK